MAKKIFKITAEVYGIIEIDDAVIDAVDDDWRSMLYDLHTPEEIAEHIAHNILFRRQRLSGLDGWADQPDSNVKIIDDLDYYFLSAEEIQKEDYE